jgi:poly-gamma-glutamate synthesis protein (capsule biosynthesis protein)
MTAMSFIATGDYLPSRRVPVGDPDFAKIRSVIHKADVRITNLEISISHQEGTPNGFSGGSHIFTTPDRLEDVRGYGFNLLATANNHCLDYGEDGLRITMKHLRDYGFAFCGTGANKAEAARAAYLDTPGGRVALISVTTSLYKPWYPGEQSRDMAGRPGANGLGCFNDLRLSKQQFDTLKEIRETTRVTNLVDMAIEQGFAAVPPGMMPFGFDFWCFPMLFRLAKEGEQPGLTTYPDPKNMARLARDVKSAKLAADAVVVNIHGHEMKTNEVESVPDFHIAASKTLIDAGADAVVIQGCHRTRGVEIYKDKPIFYSLGNFVFQDSTLTAVPQSYYDDYGAAPGETYNEIVERLRKNPEYLLSNPLVMTSVFAGWEMIDGKISAVTLYPIDLHAELPRSRNGFPALSADPAILDRVIERSRPFGTNIAKETVTLEDGTETPVGKIYLSI